MKKLVLLLGIILSISWSSVFAGEFIISWNVRDYRNRDCWKDFTLNLYENNKIKDTTKTEFDFKNWEYGIWSFLFVLEIWNKLDLNLYKIEYDWKLINLSDYSSKLVSNWNEFVLSNIKLLCNEEIIQQEMNSSEFSPDTWALVTWGETDFWNWGTPEPEEAIIWNWKIEIVDSENKLPLKNISIYITTENSNQYNFQRKQIDTPITINKENANIPFWKVQSIKIEKEWYKTLYEKYTFNNLLINNVTFQMEKIKEQEISNNWTTNQTDKPNWENIWNNWWNNIWTGANNIDNNSGGLNPDTNWSDFETGKETYRYILNIKSPSTLWNLKLDVYDNEDKRIWYCIVNNEKCQVVFDYSKENINVFIKNDKIKELLYKLKYWNNEITIYEKNDNILYLIIFLMIMMIWGYIRKKYYKKK